MLLIAGETVQAVAEDVNCTFDFVEQTFVRGVEMNAQHTGRELTGRMCANVRTHDWLTHNPHVVSIGQIEFGALLEYDLRMVLRAIEQVDATFALRQFAQFVFDVLNATSFENKHVEYRIPAQE